MSKWRTRTNEVYVVDGVRTPQGRYGGALATVRPDDLAALVVGEAVARSGVPTEGIDEVILGATNQAGKDNRNVARMAVASSLVEIVRAETTSEVLVREVAAWVELLGKTPVVVRDSPAFATSRLRVLLGLEAIRMLERKAWPTPNRSTGPWNWDTSIRWGPLRSTDLVGLDIRLAVAECLHGTLGERFAPPQLLREKVARGELGRKTGRGFYDWS